MAFVAVGEGGEELISEGCYGVPIKEWIKKENEYCTEIPKGSIEKLIGYSLTWEDEPVELKEYAEPKVKLPRLSVKGYKPTNFESDTCRFSLIEKLRQDMAKNMTSQKEALLKEAIEYALAREYQHEDIMTQGERLFLPNGAEQFSINGKVLLEFYPIDFTDEIKTITAKINYRKFYEPRVQS